MDTILIYFIHIWILAIGILNFEKTFDFFDPFNLFQNSELHYQGNKNSLLEQNPKPCLIFYLPPEIILMVLDELELENHYHLISSCKTLYRNFNQYPISKILAHLKNQKDISEQNLKNRSNLFNDFNHLITKNKILKKYVLTHTSVIDFWLRPLQSESHKALLCENLLHFLQFKPFSEIQNLEELRLHWIQLSQIEEVQKSNLEVPHPSNAKIACFLHALKQSDTFGSTPLELLFEHFSIKPFKAFALDFLLIKSQPELIQFWCQNQKPEDLQISPFQLDLSLCSNLEDFFIKYYKSITIIRDDFHENKMPYLENDQTKTFILSTANPRLYALLFSQPRTQAAHHSIRGAILNLSFLVGETQFKKIKNELKNHLHFPTLAAPSTENLQNNQMIPYNSNTLELPTFLHCLCDYAYCGLYPPKAQLEPLKQLKFNFDNTVPHLNHHPMKTYLHKDYWYLNAQYLEKKIRRKIKIKSLINKACNESQ